MKNKRKAAEILLTEAEVAEAIKGARDACDAVKATGGLVRLTNGLHAPAVDPDWIDLGEAVARMSAALSLAVPVRRLSENPAQAQA